ncbi:hypothetical protein FRC00_002188 [Tulasnella sp. 408]|nr:hypothetical protein FRC00_002188 [Tulasnella sp. 408]
MLKLFTRVRKQTTTPSPSTPQTELERKLQSSPFSPTLKDKHLLTATHQRSSSTVNRAGSMRPSKHVSAPQNDANLGHHQKIQNTMQERTRPTESPVVQPARPDGSTLSAQPSTIAVAQRRPETQPPTATALRSRNYTKLPADAELPVGSTKPFVGHRVIETARNGNLSSNREGDLVTTTANLGHRGSAIFIDSNDPSSVASDEKGGVVTATASLGRHAS